MKISTWYKCQHRLSLSIKIICDSPWETFKFTVFVILRAILIGWGKGQLAFAWFYFGLGPAKVDLGQWFMTYMKARYTAWLESTNLF